MTQQCLPLLLVYLLSMPFIALRPGRETLGWGLRVERGAVWSESGAGSQAGEDWCRQPVDAPFDEARPLKDDVPQLNP